MKRISGCAVLMAALACSTVPGDGGGVLSPPDGSFRARPSAPLAEPLQEGEGIWYGQFDVGGSVPAECWFYPEPSDPGLLLSQLGESYFQAIARGSEVGARRLVAIDAGAAAGTPYLGVDWQVRIGPNVVHAGFRYGNKGDRGLACAFGEMTLAGKLDALFLSLLESYSGGEVPDADYREVVLISIGEMRVGFQTTTIVRDADGDYETTLLGSTLVPSGPDTVVISDDFVREWSREDGSVINEVTVASDGTQVTQLALVPGDDAWNVRGEMQGKEIVGALDPSDELISFREESRLLRRLAAEGGEVTYVRWLGTVNPLAATAHRAQRLDDGRVRVEAGPLVITAEADEFGLRSGELRAGRLVMVVERVFVEGRP